MGEPDEATADATTDQGLICALQTVERLQRELERLHADLDEVKARIHRMDDRKCG